MTAFAWAIDLRLYGKSGCFLGVLGYEPRPPAWRDGCRIALWRTRNEARAALYIKRATGGEWARDHYLNLARVVRVRVEIRAL
jgi:hypothetical protein